MEKFVELKAMGLKHVRNIDPRLVSYNIEMTEVTGGTFWKKYTPEQIAGTEEFPEITDISDFTTMQSLMQYYPPIDLYNKKLRALAKNFGPVWVRVSGSWATQTYYDFEEKTNGIPPQGYKSVLTKKQWIGVLDFVKAVNAKLLISVSNCEGDHPDGGALDLTQTKKIFDFSHEYGVDIDAVEFMNEPNMLEMSGAPKGYTPKDFVRDQNIFSSWVREHYPDCLLAGPCTLGDGVMGKTSLKSSGAGIGGLMKICSTEELMDGIEIPFDVFSYHYYNNVSERIGSMLKEMRWTAKEASTDDYLDVAQANAKEYAKKRDRYVPGGQMWVTESGDAGGGGNTWASTYLDVFRTLNELGSFCMVTDGVIFHNTLASSDYGFLQHTNFEPRPNYFAVLLWQKLMGTVVYDCTEMYSKNLHVYCHSRKDGKQGYSYLIINNSLSKKAVVGLPKNADVYTLSADNVRSAVMKCNGEKLILKKGKLPPVYPINQDKGEVIVEPATCVFIII